MRPSEIFLNGPGGVPFPETLETRGAEMAAGMIVCACAMYGDQWQPVSIPMILVAINRNVRAMRQPWSSLNNNPAKVQPSFSELADKGYARFTKENRERSPIELTDKALDAIRKKWWRPSEAQKERGSA